MKIDGKTLAETLLQRLSQDVTKLKAQGVTPTLAVILVGDDVGSLSYIKQKQKAAEKIGATVIFDHQPSSISNQQLQHLVEHYNNDPTIHGLIVQRPVPKELGDVTEILNAVNPSKDVDGFVPHSPFPVPVAAAVFTILTEVYTLSLSLRGVTDEAISKDILKIASPSERSRDDDNEFLPWLRSQNIVVIGRGETAGKPINELLISKGCTTSVIHSKTPNPKELIQQADIIISCVGKKDVITKNMLLNNYSSSDESSRSREVIPTSQSDNSQFPILISVGIWRDDAGKLHGDYEEDAIADVAAAYTPTPGGVGPVNVACLMQNLITAAQKNIDD